ncbi:CARDB domain-containing protein [Halostagnicola larsenii]|uniref:CARDB domain-containing protein n=1 Tax=Halostagnicola larsenii TaxID=353800 RepID=UPI000A75838D|nr:CARDB domain-containing protein [Halostagnicola larsenii]
MFARGTRYTLAILIALAFGFALLGLAVGTGTAAIGQTDGFGGLESVEPLADGNETQSQVALVEEPFTDPRYNDRVLVTFDGSVVRGEHATAEETPENPSLSVGGDPVVSSDGSVKVLDGDHVTVGESGVTENSAGEIVTGDTGQALTVDGNGTVRAGEDGPVAEAGGTTLEYEHYDEAIPVVEFGDSTNVSEGEQLSTTVDVTNVGYGSIEDEIKLEGVDTNGSYDSIQIGDVDYEEIAGGDTDSLTFEHTLVAGDHQIDELRLGISSQQFTEPIDITKSEIAITNVETNDPVEGETLTVEADLERRGALDLDDRTLTFSVDGTEVDSRAITLAEGASITEEFSYETDESNASTVDVEVAVPEDSNTAAETVTVVSGDEHNESMTATITNEPIANLSAEFEVVAAIDYDGDVPGGETVVPTTFRIDGSIEEERNVTVEDGSATEETFSTYLTDESVPLTNVSVETPGRSDTLEFERNLTTAFADVDESFSSEETLDAVVTVENDGDTPEVVELTVSVDAPDGVDGDGSETQTVSVNPSESVESEFAFEPTEDAPSDLELTAETNGSSEPATATATRPTFTIEDVGLEGADNANSGLNMSGNVTNAGELPDSQSVQFTLDGELVGEETVSLAAGESKTVETAIEPPAENGEYEYGMTANNESAGAAESAEGSAQIDVSGQSILDRVSSFALPLALLALLALLAIGVVALKYRDDPEALQAQVLAAKSRVQNAVQGVVGGGGSVIVENGLPRDSTVRLQVKDENGVVFQEDLQLADGEQRKFPSLPGDGQFEVGVGVDDVASHSEVFQANATDVGVVLQPNGITIAEL